MSTSRLALAGIAVAVALALALTGCTPHSTPKSVTTAKSGVPSHAGTPSATPMGLPPGVLFRVSTTALAPDGGRARLVETVSDPLPPDGTEDAKMTASQCDGNGFTWRSSYPSTGIQWLHVEMTTTVQGTNWLGNDGLLIFSGARLGNTAWTGSVDPFQAYCADAAAVRVPGDAAGVTPVTNDPAADTAWQSGQWGFSAVAEEGDATPQPGVTFPDCTIELGSAAQAYADRLPRMPQTYAAGCMFGTQPS